MTKSKIKNPKVKNPRRWILQVNGQYGPLIELNPENCTRPDVISKVSAIDEFYSSTQNILSICATHSIHAAPGTQIAHILYSLSLVGLVSASEQYFRSVVSNILMVCPVARKSASSKSINFASALWYHPQDIARGSFEGTALSDKKAVANFLKDFVGLNESKYQTMPLQQTLNNYGTLCELRHCIVHSMNNIQGKNATNLQLSNPKGRRAIELDFASIQTAASVCTTMVRVFNTVLFDEIVYRWAKEWDRKSKFDAAAEKVKFRSVWDIFFSRIDKSRASSGMKRGWRSCFNEARRHHNL